MSEVFEQNQAIWSVSSKSWQEQHLKLLCVFECGCILQAALGVGAQVLAMGQHAGHSWFQTVPATSNRPIPEAQLGPSTQVVVPL